MDAFAVPLVIFGAALAWLLVEIIRGSFDDPYPRRAGVTWAVTCPTAMLLFGVGLAPLAVIAGAVSMLALGSLCWWFVGTERDDTEDEPEASIEPDPGPSDDAEIEIPAWALRAPEEKPAAKPKSDIDWDAFDRLREEWEREFTIPATEPEREPQPEPARV